VASWLSPVARAVAFSAGTARGNNRFLKGVWWGFDLRKIICVGRLLSAPERRAQSAKSMRPCCSRACLAGRSKIHRECRQDKKLRRRSTLGGHFRIYPQSSAPSRRSSLLQCRGCVGRGCASSPLGIEIDVSTSGSDSGTLEEVYRTLLATPGETSIFWTPVGCEFRLDRAHRVYWVEKVP